jgi:hypothetical protein
MAAAQNPALRYLYMDAGAEVPLAETAALLRTTQRLQAIVMPLVNSTTVAKAFGANRTLERVLFHYNPDASPAPPNGACLSKLGAHPRLYALRILDKSESANPNTAVVDVALSGYLKEAKRLEELVLDNFTFNEGRMQNLLKGLSVNRSLMNLHLNGCVFRKGALRVAQSFASRTLTDKKHTRLRVENVSLTDRREQWCARLSGSYLSRGVSRRR